MPAPSSHERNLLFAGLGLQLSLLTREHLVRAFSEWILNKNLSLGEILVQQKAISPEQQKTIGGAVEARIQNDGGEVQALASVKNAHEVESSLKNIEDNELQMTLSIMHALQSRKFVGNELTIPPGLHQSLPVKKHLEQRFQRKHFLDAGNLGEIWFAKDEELNRTVVLKFIKAEQQSSPFSKALFILEGEVTGYLEHPAVVPVYSMGQDAKERSFYAMRYIRGRKLTRAIADYHAIPASSIGKRRESLTELLQMFQTACLAIEYAHSKGVLHCDLKPDNIVVGPFGETLVIDWGLAMVTNPTSDLAQEINNLENNTSSPVSGEMAGPYSPSESARPGLHSSQGGMRKFVGGTPAYMAPEQMRATRGGEVKEVTYACDIFSLGAILYQLLASRAPYFPVKEKHEGNEEFFKRIEKGECPRPSQLNPSISKPLEAIVLKAMAASNVDRYGSARELAEEVKRWLADEPVHAYRENTWEKSRRWARNNRSTVVAGIVLLGCLGIGGAGFGLVTQGFNIKLQNQERLANEQRDLAQKREAMAIASVKQYAEAVEKNPDLKNKPELESLRKELLKEPIHFFKELSDQLRSEKSPSTKSLNDLAEGLFNLASLTAEIGNQEDAITSYKEAVAIQETLVGPNSTNSDFQKDLAGSYNNLANLYRATNCAKEAEESYQKALAIQETLVKANPTNSELQNNLAGSYNNLATLYEITNRFKEAEEGNEKALAIQETLVKANPTNSELQFGLAHSFTNLATLYTKNDRLKEAEKSYLKALATQETLVKANPTNSKFQSGLAGSQNNLASFYHSTNRPKEAEAYYLKAREILEAVVKANPTSSMFQAFLVGTYHNLGSLYSATIRPMEAEASYQKALAIQKGLVEANPANSEFQNELAKSHNNLAVLYYSTNRLMEAGGNFQKALSIFEILVKANPTISGFQSALAISHYNLANVHRDTNRSREADESYQKALVLQEALVKANPSNSKCQADLARSHHNLGFLYSAMNRQKEAEESYQKALTLQEALVKANLSNSKNQADLARSRNNLAILFRKANRLKEAEESFQKALTLQEELVKANPSNSNFQTDLARTKNNFANLHNAIALDLASKEGKGKAEYKKGSHQPPEGLKPNRTPREVLNTLGIAQFRAKQFAAALGTLEKSNAFNSKTKGKEDPVDLAFLAMTCHQLGKKAEAEGYFKKLQEAMKDKKNSENKEYQGFLKEADSLLKK